MLKKNFKHIYFYISTNFSSIDFTFWISFKEKKGSFSGKTTKHETCYKQLIDCTY